MYGKKTHNTKSDVGCYSKVEESEDGGNSRKITSHSHYCLPQNKKPRVEEHEEKQYEEEEQVKKKKIKMPLLLAA